MRSFVWTVSILWVAASVAGALYSSQQNIPFRIAASAIAALLVEAALYLMPGVEEFRARLQAVEDPLRQGAWLWSAAMLPYCIYSLGAGCFTFEAFAWLAGIAGFLSFWYAIAPWREMPMQTDLLILAVAAGILLSDVFKAIYPQLAPKATVSILGQLMLIRTYAFALLCIRKHDLAGFGFWPSRTDWAVGLRQFVYFVPLGFALAYAIGFTTFRPFQPAKMIPVFLLTFLGILWVVALSEELFFRGVLQQHLQKLTANRWKALIGTSLLFGMVHLPFREFPNWKFMLMATAAGLFYGRAFQETGSIRSAMVTHALVASIWKVFLT
jgi:membrane protease YdiL (CAAX protease family)